MSESKSLTIAELVRQSYDTAEAHGWHALGASPVERFCLMHSEISEALEDYRSGRAVDHIYCEPSVVSIGAAKPCGVPIELADVVIRIADFCGCYDIDLNEAIRIKQAYNETRPYLHGGKKL